MPRTIRIKPGERRTIIRRNFSSMPTNFHFRASALNGARPNGRVEICGSNWIFRKPVSMQRLRSDNVVYAGFWDTFFSVSVIAYDELEVILPGRSWPVNRWVIWSAVLCVVVIILISLMIISFTG